MAEPDLKLDVPCPRCGTTNLPIARRCRHCHLDIGFSQKEFVGSNLIELARSSVVCGACGSTNPFNAEICGECGSELTVSEHVFRGIPLDELETPAPAPRRSRRRRSPGSLLNLYLRMVGPARVAALLFLLYGVVDTGSWLSTSNKDLAPADPAGLRYTLFAIYELLRNACVAGGVWLLTSFQPRTDK
ncbi:MAG: zinc ribbon domain-containing protein [Candidatus Sericytochromatia bacterium]|nr:zinc ribbon domain-containing protein [Candidatus Sericytochromatia bacterium]